MADVIFVARTSARLSHWLHLPASVYRLFQQDLIFRWEATDRVAFPLITASNGADGPRETD